MGRDSPNGRHVRLGAVGRVEQLSGSGLAPCAGASALQDLVSEVWSIISAAEGHQFLLRALAEKRDDVAVLRRGGLVRVCRFLASLAI